MNALNRLNLNDTVTFDDGSRWTLVAIYRGREAKLREQGTADHVQVIALPYLLEQVGPAQPASEAEVRVPDDNWPADTVQMVKHVQEVWECVPLSGGSGASRQGYGPDVKLGKRVDNKLAELRGTDLETSRSSLYRYRRAFEEGGIAAVNALLHPQRPQKLAAASATPELLAVIDEVLSERTYQSTITVTQAIHLVRLRWAERYRDLKLDLSDRQLRRYINELQTGRYTFGTAGSRRSAANQPGRQYGFGRSNRPGARVEMDSTPLDMVVRAEDGSSYRPHLTVMLDVATAVPLAWGFRPKAMTGADHAVLLARAIVPRRAHPNREATRLAASATLPAALLHEIDRRRNGDTLALPWIFPEEITIDGGADFRGSTFEAACHKYGVTLNLAPPHTPTSKPHVERFFGTVNKRFTQWLAGSIGNSPAHRGRTDDPVWGLADLEELFEYWVTAVYLHTPTSALRDPFSGMLWTPNQMYAALFETSGGIALPFDADDYIDLLPVELRKVQRDGIYYQNRTYDSPRLNPLRGRRSNTHDGKWKVKVDPYNPAAVFIKDPTSGEWLTIPDRTLDWRTAPMVAETSAALVQSVSEQEPSSDARHAAFVSEVKLMEGELRKEAARQNHRSNVPRPQVEVPTQPDVIDACFDFDGLDDEAMELINPKEEL